MDDHLQAAGLLEPLRSGELPTKMIWKAIQTLFAAMNEVQELVTSRLGSKTRVVFASSTGYTIMPAALNFVYAMLVLIAEGNGWRVLMVGLNRELEPVNLRLFKSEVVAAWADVSHALRGFYELADILIVLDEVLCLEVSKLARQLKFNPAVDDDDPVITHLKPACGSGVWIQRSRVPLARRGGQTTREGMWRQPKNKWNRSHTV